MTDSQATYDIQSFDKGYNDAKQGLAYNAPLFDRIMYLQGYSDGSFTLKEITND